MNNEMRSAKFGTFGGVFTPSVLTILGVIMYLRMGWVVGSVGLTGALVIVTVSSSITFLTALSVSSIATDRIVRTGGAYYMISRSLGIEGGGAVGIPLYIAQAFSVPLYTIGFAESVALTFPGVDQRTVGLIVTVLIAVLAIKSARIAIKAQYLIMGAIALSLLSFLLGSGPSSAQTSEISVAAPAAAGAGIGFWAVFAVFFPAVTGIMAGINMSGDLRDPAKSIPLGTLAAVGTGYLIYMGLPILLSMRASSEELLSNPLIMFGMSRWGALILAGVWGATLSSAIGSILGAPRVLQALARDGVLPRPMRWLGRGSGLLDEPRAGTVLTLIIALSLVAVGDLNMIAPILTMFFLTTYLVLNLSAGIEGFLKNPSFRPAFRVHWGLSMLGAAGCAAAMLLISPVATAVAAVLVSAIYIWLQRRDLEASWGDVRSGLWMMLVRAGLLRIDGSEDTRNWRPNFLVLSGAPTRRWHLVRFADMISHRKGIFTVATVLPEDSVDAAQKASFEITLKDYLRKKGVPALVRVITAPDPFTGAADLVELYGLGPVIPDTVLLGDTENEDPDMRMKYFKFVRAIHSAGRNLVIFRDSTQTPLDDDEVGKAERRIDLWWGGLEGNGGLMLILADALRFDPGWTGAELRIKLMVSDTRGTEPARVNLEKLISRHNIRASYEIIDGGGRSFSEVFRESSRDVDIIFHGLAEPGDDFAAYYRDTHERLEGMPSTVLVLAGRDTTYSNIIQKDQD